ncbi:MAG: insulinase family protein [Oscillospiraceae bacterium]|nr:insulinase family protein [Oscillospiraceae bacterium]
MKQHVFPRLGEEYWQEILDNGLTVRVVPKRGFARSYAFVGVDYGAVDTRFQLGAEAITTPGGVAHYLEHKMFDLPEGDAMNLFAQYGASPNAFTGYAMTAYYFDCTENFEENLRILLRMVATPYFSQQSVEKERGIIAQEIRMYEDSADSRLYEDLFAALFASHPIRVPIAGTVESIQEITNQTLETCHAAFYHPANMMLCVVGDVDPARVAQVARELTETKRRALPVRDYGAQESVNCVKPRVERTMEVSMPTFAFGFKCEAPTDGGDAMKAEIIGALAAEILAGESSPLFMRLYEQGLIDSGFAADYESVKNACIFTVSGDSRDPDAVYQAVLDEGKRLAKEGFPKEDFERLVKSALGRRMRDLDSFESICYRMCAYHFEGVDYFRFPAVYESVQAEDVQAFLSRTVQESRAAISIIRPKEREE